MTERNFDHDLIQTIASLRTRDEAAKNVRDLIIAFGKEISIMIRDLRAESVATVGLRVRAVVRGPVGEVELPSGGDLEVEALPALDEPGYESRPGAIALYLEVFPETSDRVYFELRSNPGLIVMADVNAANVNAMERFSMQMPSAHLDQVRGIRRVGNEIKLVSMYGAGEFKDSFTPRGFFGAFMTCIKEIADEQARFNLGDGTHIV